MLSLVFLLKEEINVIPDDQVFLHNRLMSGLSVVTFGRVGEFGEKMLASPMYRNISSVLL